ncbi:hypothetical protein Tco_0029138 [Tanacetum coccineum]
MDLFGPTSVRSINHKTYCLVVTDEDETSGILKTFITGIENQINHKSLGDGVADDAGKKTYEEPANEDERNGQEKGGASNKEDD